MLLLVLRSWGCSEQSVNIGELVPKWSYILVGLMMMIVVVLVRGSLREVATIWLNSSALLLGGRAVQSGIGCMPGLFPLQKHGEGFLCN